MYVASISNPVEFDHQLPTADLVRLGMPDRMIAHVTRKEQLTEVGMDPAGIAASVRDAVKAAAAGESRDPALSRA
jgi:deoxyxylulose-5-phosphate synthase